MSVVLGSVGDSYDSVFLGCVGGSWMCRWFLDVSMFLECVSGY